MSMRCFYSITKGRIVAVVLALGVAAAIPTRAIAQVEGTQGTIDAALKAAGAAHQPVLVDFSALWCHACWWMKKNVMNGTQWDALLNRLVYIESDADSADGEAWMKKLAVAGLPTYVVLGSDGTELGRVVGEVEAEKFYPKIERLIGGTDTLEKLKAQAAHGTPADVAQVLEAYAARNDFKVATSWYALLPEPVRSRAAADPIVTVDLELMQAQVAKHSLSSAKTPATKAALAKSCAGHGERALSAGPNFDDRIQIIDVMADCTEDFAPEQRKALLMASLATALAQLDAKKLSIRPLPSGTREAVLILAETTKALGDKDGAKAIYANGVAAYRQQMDDGKGGLDLTSDRSAADDLYALYRFSEQTDQTASLVKQLADTYSTDCNYSLAYGRILLKGNKAAEALTYLEKAAELARGRYVLRVANARAKALIALQRRPEAEMVVADALREAGAWFPTDQRELKEVLSSSGGA